MDILEHIGSIPLFQELPIEHQRELAAIAADRSYKQGHAIFAEGDPGKGFYVIISGRIKVFKFSFDGKEQILHFFGSGEPIGEAAVFAGKPFPANAETLEQSRLLFFSRSDFLKLVQKEPALAMNMLAVLSQRLRRFAALIDDLSLKEVPGRLAAYLVYMCKTEQDSEVVMFDISMKQLSSLLGTIPETLSRIVTRMARAGLIQSEGSRCMRILDRTGLEELATGERRLQYVES